MPRKQKLKIDSAGIVTIIVAVIGLIGTLGAAYLNSRPKPDPIISEENQISSSPTEIIDTNIATPTIEIGTSQVLVDARHATDSDFEKFAPISVKDFQFIKSSDDEFTLNNLAPYDILIINFSGYELSPQRRESVQDFTSSEITAIQNYIEQGGNVFIITANWVWTAYDKKPMEEFPLNLITQNYGISFSSGVATDCVKDGSKIIVSNDLFDQQSELAKNINQIATLDDGVPGFLIVQSPASIIATCNTGVNPILATSQSGKGKIAVISHPNFVLSNLSDSNYDNYDLLLNILNWLVSEN